MRTLTAISAAVLLALTPGLAAASGAGGSDGGGAGGSGESGGGSASAEPTMPAYGCGAHAQLAPGPTPLWQGGVVVAAVLGVGLLRRRRR
jgi:MYXO-CTERM domain-containing protein